MKFRDMSANDLNFVLDSWLKSFRKSKHAGVVPNDLYYSVYRRTVEDLLGRGAKVIVACSDTNDDTVIGWICYEPDCIHYVYSGLENVRNALFAQSNLTNSCSFTFNTKDIRKLTSGQWRPEIARKR